MNPADAAKLERRNRDLLILNTIAEALNREVDLDAALKTTLEHVTALFDVQTGWVWLQNSDTQSPYLAAHQNLPPALANDPVRFEGSCYCLDTYQLGALDGATNISFVTCSRLKELHGNADGLRYHASIPLYHHDKKVGLLNVARSDWQELSPDDLRLLSTVADLLSIAIERAQLFTQSVQLGAVEERNRIAREIHDTLAQGLSAITLHLEAADAVLEQDQDRARHALHQALMIARANLDEARRSVLDLRAATLEGYTLTEALAHLIDNFASEAKIETNFRVTGGSSPLPERIEVTLYRITQEALTNIITHANAEHVNIELSISPDHLQLVIEDDGNGFDPDAIPPNRFGLVGINERAKLLNGSLRLCSEIGEGTTLTITIPL